MCPSWLSPQYTFEGLDDPYSLEVKINVFEDRVRGWQLNVADTMLNGCEESPRMGSYLADSGFASLAILTSYFEMIAQHDKGESSKGKSKKFFIHGFKLVFDNEFSGDTENVAAALYSYVRCGMYHDGITKAHVRISGEFRNAIEYDTLDRMVYINPHIMVRKLKEHFHHFVQTLKDDTNIAARTKFGQRFIL